MILSRAFLAKVVALSSDIADVLSTDVSKQSLDGIIKKINGVLNIDRNSIVPILESAINEIESMASLFEVDIGDEEYLQSIVEQAREIMLARNLHTMQKSSKLEDANLASALLMEKSML